MRVAMSTERRRAPRIEMETDCALFRRVGGPVTGTTIDLGTGGMRIASKRPLRDDEEVEFALPGFAPDATRGRARVLRQQRYGVYALRFERLPEDMAAALADHTPPPSAG
jgi:hypothetical protein